MARSDAGFFRRQRPEREERSVVLKSALLTIKFPLIKLASVSQAPVGPSPTPAATAAPTVACSCNVTMAEKEVLAADGKVLYCDAACLDTEDIYGHLWCNFFGLGQVRQRCSGICQIEG